MKKIPTVLVRDPDDRAHVLDEVTPGCEWVLAGEGVTTRKYDGTCLMIDPAGCWWARREVKPGKAWPDGFAPAEHHEVTGKTVGWEPIEQSPFYRYWQEALHHLSLVRQPGTYELIGPKINGNHEHLFEHRLIAHAEALAIDDLRDVDVRSVEHLKRIMRVCAGVGWEGVVWHHLDGRMAKLKVRDLNPRDLEEHKTA